MGLTMARQLGRTATASGLLAGLMILPLPAFAFTISNWSFVNMGVNAFNPNGDTKIIEYVIPSGGFNSNIGNTGNSNIQGFAGEQVSAFLNLTGMTIFNGSLTVSVTVGSQTVSHTFGPGAVTTFAFGPYTLNGSLQAVNVQFHFNGATFSYNGTQSTVFHLIFR